MKVYQFLLSSNYYIFLNRLRHRNRQKVSRNISAYASVYRKDYVTTRLELHLCFNAMTDYVTLLCINIYFNVDIKISIK
jgi:hypothetical protein